MINPGDPKGGTFNYLCNANSQNFNPHHLVPICIPQLKLLQGNQPTTPIFLNPMASFQLSLALFLSQAVVATASLYTLQFPTFFVPIADTSFLTQSLMQTCGFLFLALLSSQLISVYCFNYLAMTFIMNFKFILPFTLWIPLLYWFAETKNTYSKICLLISHILSLIDTCMSVLLSSKFFQEPRHIS